MSIVDDAIEKLLADRRNALQDAAYWKREAEKLRQILDLKIYESRRHKQNCGKQGPKNYSNRAKGGILQARKERETR
jgi:hypothetical protein